MGDFGISSKANLLVVYFYFILKNHKFIRRWDKKSNTSVVFIVSLIVDEIWIQNKDNTFMELSKVSPKSPKRFYFLFFRIFIKIEIP